MHIRENRTKLPKRGAGWNRYPNTTIGSNGACQITCSRRYVVPTSTPPLTALWENVSAVDHDFRAEWENPPPTTLPRFRRARKRHERRTGERYAPCSLRDNALAPPKYPVSRSWRRSHVCCHLEWCQTRSRPDRAGTFIGLQVKLQQEPDMKRTTKSFDQNRRRPLHAYDKHKPKPKQTRVTGQRRLSTKPPAPQNRRPVTKSHKICLAWPRRRALCAAQLLCTPPP